MLGSTGGIRGVCGGLPTSQRSSSMAEPTVLARPSEAPPFETPAPYPEQIFLDWTTYCNAKCFFCPRNISGGDFVPLATLTKLEKVLSSVKYFSMSSSIGEPLLHPELRQILEWLYRINPTVPVRVTTNGTALTAQKAAWFAGHLDWLSVSLNASNGEAHMRDMFPHLAERGIDAEKRWELHLRHIAEFIAALPAEDRPRVRLNMIAHRHNIEDIIDFIHVVQRVGGSHATITNILVHPNIVGWSLYGVRDLYNEAIDAARDLGTRLGIRVDASRFLTSVKSPIDLDTYCREPLDVAYISRSSVGAPCCQWSEEGLPQDVYSDDEGFDRYWNQDVYRRLRQKRNLASCRACNLGRVFDESSFHLSPQLKHVLIASGQLPESHRESDYPEEQLVRTCVENWLDLPSIRHTLRELDLPVEMSEQIETLKLAAVPVLDQACWDAFRKLDVPAGPSDIYVAGPFAGIGWGPPSLDPGKKISARLIGGAKVASIFVRVTPGLDCVIHVTIAYPSEVERRLQVEVCGRRVEPRFSRDEAGRTLLVAFVPEDLTRLHDGRLWVRLACRDDAGQPLAGWLLVMRFSISQADAMAAGPEQLVIQLERLIADKGASLRQQAAQLSELEQQLSQLEQQLSERNAKLAEL